MWIRIFTAKANFAQWINLGQATIIVLDEEKKTAHIEFCGGTSYDVTNPVGFEEIEKWLFQEADQQLGQNE